MIQRMSGADPMTAGALSEEVGVAQSTLSRWLREASFTMNSDQAPAIGFFAEVNKLQMPPKRAKDWIPEEKLQAVLEASGLPEGELGAFLRIKGIHDIHLQQWRKEMLNGLQNASPVKKTKGKSPEAKRLRELEKELNRKEKALAEAAVLLVLKKKAQAIWGDEDDDIAQRNGK
jgi:transposase-like protein